MKAPVVMAAVYDWTGFYIGTNLGYSWGRASTNGTQTIGSVVAAATTVTPMSGRADVNGFIGGGQLGYNWQQGAWVFGLEGDIQLSNERGSGDVCTGVCPTGFGVHQGLQAGLVWHRARARWIPPGGTHFALRYWRSGLRPF